MSSPPEDILHFVNFINGRLKQFLAFTLLTDLQEKWLASCKMLEPGLPSLIRSGNITKESTVFPQLKKNECTIVVAPHYCDLDWGIIMMYANPQFNKENAIVYDTSRCKTINNDSKSTNENFVPLMPTAFTHSHFMKVPVIGSTVKQLLIGVHRGMTEQELIGEINKKRRIGYNTFVLFPEGKIHCKSAIQPNREFWEANVKQQDPYEYKEVLYPRFTGYQALVKALGTDLKYIVDATIRYAHHKPWETEFNYTNYPSIVHSFHNKIDPVRLHTNIIHVNGRWQQVLSKEWFIEKIWKPKDKLLRLWRLQEQAESKTEAIKLKNGDENVQVKNQFIEKPLNEKQKSRSTKLEKKPKKNQQKLEESNSLSL